MSTASMPQNFDQISEIRTVNDAIITLDRIRVLRTKCLDDTLTPKDMDDICWLLDWTYNHLLTCDVYGAI